MSEDFYAKKRARFLATKDAFLAKNVSNKKEDLKEHTTVIVRKGWRTLVKRPEKLLK
jgi:hypothetical protein